MPAATVSVEAEPRDTVIYPADGPNVDRVGAQNLLSHGSTLYLNTGTTHPGLLLSETGGASWRSQPIELSHLPPPPEGRSHDVAGFFVTSCAPLRLLPARQGLTIGGGRGRGRRGRRAGVLLAVHQLGDGLGTDYSEATPVYVSRSLDSGATWTSTVRPPHPRPAPDDPDLSPGAGLYALLRAAPPCPACPNAHASG